MRPALLDLTLPEPVLREWEQHVRAGIPLSDRAKAETLAALRHAFVEDCGCEPKPLPSGEGESAA